MTLGEYVKETIYNNRITAKDVREGRTGFNHLDSLDPKTTDYRKRTVSCGNL